ncbi:UNVERIFIED_CONTAM: hypothetical protein Sradi_5124000 [Sesamum radiatum]|uniref:DUF4216 domain-containing protein n=1 Tax=Sesamum radiatum TaxID=300843 RepID=A0AAW2M1Z1_SESRA
MLDMLNDFSNAYLRENLGSEETRASQGAPFPLGRADTFFKLLKDSEEKLYEGCESYSKLIFLVKLLHLKTISGWTNKSFDMLLELLKEAFQGVDVDLPKSYSESKRLMRDLGFKYEKIHSCPNDCVLFWKEYENFENCPKCGTCKWKYEGSKKIPRKVLRYFPLKPRLQRLFVNKDLAENMRWHKEKLVHENDVMRHPADSELWRDFDKKYPLFADDPRPKGPGNDIDVYLQPLIDELKELWEVGIEAYDAYKKENFILRAALMWTISDLPAYSYLSGWITSGYFACPICMSETTCEHLPNSQKRCYMGHRRFLPSDHKWRDEMKAFDGKKDDRCAPVLQSGEEIMEQLSSIEQVQFDGFASNISRCVKEKELTISGLKSHDCHVLLQRLLPLATRGYLHKEVKRVEQLHSEGLANDELISLANGPDTRVKHYTGCNVNGFRFHTKDRENNKKTQNSGVVVEGEHNKKIIDFYGVVKDIIEVDYLQGAKRVLIFKCDWWNLNDRSGIQMDRNSNITSVNVSKTWYDDQPFVLAYQVRQAFYLQDLKLGKNWHIVEKTQPRGTYEIPNQKHIEPNDLEDPYQEEEPEEAYLFEE